MKYTELIPILISMISLIISLIVVFSNRSFSKRNISENIRKHYMGALYELDKLLISDPSLWAVYDNHPLAKEKKMDELSKGKREAFIYYLINLWETIFHDYNDTKNHFSHEDEFWYSWDNYITHFIKNSSEGRELISSYIITNCYRDNYVKYLELKMKNANKAL